MIKRYALKCLHRRQMVMLIFVVNVVALKAQDANFSQYHYTPLHVNPACVGKKDERIIILNNRASVGNSQQNTNAFMVTAMVPLAKKDRKFGGFGINAFTSKEGEMGLFVRSGISAALSQTIRLNQRHRLSMGLQAGLQRQRVTIDKLTTSNQWVNNYGYDQRQSQGEDFENLSSSYGTISAGLYWYMKDNDGDEKVFLGVAGFNLNQPEETFMANDNFSSIRYNVQGGFWAYKSRTIVVTPEVMLINTGRTSLWYIGSQFNYYMKPASLFSSGNYISLQLRYGTNNTMISMLQFTTSYFTMGVSYDTSLVSNSALNVDSFELLLALRKRSSKKNRPD